MRLNDFIKMRMLDRRSNLALLGYFALIESILTHAPKLSDPYDSITRQIKSKMALLHERFEFAPDYRVFGEVKPDKIWSSLYSYRSKVAHGSQPDFSKDLKIIKSHETALYFIRSATRALLAQVLKEPKLIRDLQQC